MNLYDAHNHLHFPELKSHRAEIFVLYEERNVRKAVSNGAREEDWELLAELARADNRVLPAFGLHPWHVKEASSNWREKLCEHLDEFPFCVGEIGLDKWIEGFDLEKQIEAFRFQLQEAEKRRLAMAIHCLKAWGLMLEIIKEQRPERFLLHSFGGSAEMAEEFSKLGGYFSISGYFAYPRKQKQREIFQNIPLDRLLIETDAPDMLPPEKYRTFSILDDEHQELNHPGNIESIYKFAAELFGQEVEPFARQIETNFKTFFALD